MATFDDLVFGERLGDLLPVLRKLTEEAHLDSSGMCQFNGEFEADVATPLFRALMRAEAELLVEDADALRPGRYGEQRTRDERSADALMRLAQAMSALP